jgi:hypothetical protein
MRFHALDLHRGVPEKEHPVARRTGLVELRVSKTGRVINVEL